MKLSCNVIQDLLPLYHDGVCSDESRVLVEEHVRACESCRALLRELRGEVTVPHEAPDDLGAMKSLEGQVRKKTWIKGITAALAAVLVLGGMLAGLSILESRRYQAKFQPFFSEHEAVVLYEDETYEAVYDWVYGNYRFRVHVPRPGYQGLIEVDEFHFTKDRKDPVELSLIVRFADDGYLYDIAIEGTDSKGIWYRETLTIDQKGQTVDDPNWDEETLARKDTLAETYRTEILNIIMAAEREWPFLTE